MFERILHVLKAHLRAVLLLMFVASAVTFSGTLLLSVFLGLSSDRERSNVDEGLFRQQIMLENRMRLLEEGSRTAKTELTSLLARQQIGGGDGNIFVGSSELFPMENLVETIVQLVCIDNKDKETYYTASGTMVDETGLILTNSHILLSEDNSLISFCGVGFTRDLREPPVIEYIAEAKALHEDADLALLEITEMISGEEVDRLFPAVRFSPEGGIYIAPSLGERIFIGGYPGIGADTFTVTQGVVSGLVGANLIKTSALIDSGTSGGAAFDYRGTYIGVPTAAVPGDIGGSLGYLISASVVDSFMKGYYSGEYRL